MDMNSINGVLRDAMHGKHGWPRLHWLNVGGSPCDSMEVPDCRAKRLL